jgi:hypothetical protein
MSDGTLGTGGRYDGVDEFLTRSTNSTNSSSNGSPNMADRVQGGGFAQSPDYQTLRQNVNPYFANAHLSTASASGNESTLYNPSPLSAQTLSSSGSATPTARSASPSSVPGFTPLNAPFSGQHPQDRFPFAVEAHASPAIRG